MKMVSRTEGKMRILKRRDRGSGRYLLAGISRNTGLFGVAEPTLVLSMAFRL